MISRALVVTLGVSQLICWGISYYLIGGFGEMIAADLGWSRTLVYGGFSAALVAMGLFSPSAGRMIDRFGGRPVMVAGSLLLALGCAGLALSRGIVSYYAAWCCLGIAMRLTLYDAAFAALAYLGGASAKRSMAQITLLGGLASTTFWPIGDALADIFGWRGALVAYAGIALLTLPLHLAIPTQRFPHRDEASPKSAAGRRKRGAQVLAALLYVVIVTLTNVLNSGMSAHMIPILAGLGVAASVAVWIATLRGIGQSLARVAEVLFGQKLSPLVLTVLASSVLPLCFIAGLFSGRIAASGIAFAFLYGMGNGLLTIVRGTLPLVLFDPRSYGTTVGRLITPSFLLSAAAPLAYASVIEHLGNSAALWLSAALGALIFGSAIILWALFRPGAAETGPVP